MSDLKELLEEASTEQKLKFSTWLESLDEDDRKAMYAYAASSGISTRKFHEIVLSKGVGISREDLQKWRIKQGLKV